MLTEQFGHASIDQFNKFIFQFHGIDGLCYVPGLFFQVKILLIFPDFQVTMKNFDNKIAWPQRGVNRAISLYIQYGHTGVFRVVSTSYPGRLNE